ncbi:MAG: hypothetical protein R3B71_00025 [Candidatus Gracilibacteria bacterium]|nr:hypothetical protein [Candidatus Peregrinibacteria bacterium]
MAAERLQITSPDERPVNTAPRMPQGFLAQLKDDWASEGCQVPDSIPLEDKIAAFEEIAMSGTMSSAEVEELRIRTTDRIECKRIAAEIGDRLLKILEHARVSDPEL